MGVCSVCIGVGAGENCRGDGIVDWVTRCNGDASCGASSGLTCVVT